MTKDINFFKKLGPFEKTSGLWRYILDFVELPDDYGIKFKEDFPVIYGDMAEKISELKTMVDAGEFDNINTKKINSNPKLREAYENIRHIKWVFYHMSKWIEDIDTKGHGKVPPILVQLLKDHHAQTEKNFYDLGDRIPFLLTVAGKMKESKPVQDDMSPPRISK